MPHILTTDFFNRDTLAVAEELLGKFLVRRNVNGISALKITEVEAYDGHQDRASHAYRGRTARNEIMFGPAGLWYIYFVYGMHEMLNIVTGPEAYPAAVLIRGVEGVNGPGRVTKHLNITRNLNTLSARKESGLWIEDRGIIVSKKEIHKTPRIGISYAGPVWGRKKYRFLITEIKKPAA
ncbi:MAG: 3-methyladenine DNA glycosylase [Candidatus Lloydbacteria bacterium CG22_combo_CG10-13_8_21_14_all_47_15]|uniref:Putative 3-methyladenine DNA glycosylase n=1 Tax=Candidatus Lloydbacteria bacterium CG22_combo_CG10-13_8_21_14_all_47_15 TaxID=1974635 RepID=A0A2H0CU41_9BACT|nr:MAG: 3-methyladenine DNA glycosylase [Candidatus Lloydbacteria bacterium CG22_combo_CG10-13_8_21_14_all_47_15]